MDYMAAAVQGYATGWREVCFNQLMTLLQFA